MIKRWGPFLIISVFYFHITAATFTSLGVALPHMMSDMGWSYSKAGTGFSLLALMVGLSALVPAWIIRKSGVKATFAIGGIAMIAGFVLLATTNELIQYYVGASLTGLGYTLVAIVPAVHYFNKTISWDKRPAIIGAYMTVGGLGGVAGPLMVVSIVEITESWRMHWWLLAFATVVLTILAVIFLDNNPSGEGLEKPVSDDPEDADSTSEYQWSYAEVLRTKEFHIIVIAMTLTLFCGLTLNSWAVTHMVELGVSSGIAAGALSAHALINALSRALGGYLGSRVNAKWLLVAALAAEMVGMIALAFADTPLTIALFAIGEGFGFGMCLFATTLLLVNYFGTHKNPEILGSMHFVTTLAMLGPGLAGWSAERLGGFGPVFLVYSVMVGLVLLAAIFMRPPQGKRQERLVSD